MIAGNGIERKLDEREAAILKALVYEYIITGKPVGSRSFVQKYSFSISPATMRNVMSDLEALGYLKQPHTSAGRIPTDRGYRYYVDSIMDKYSLGVDSEVKVKDQIAAREVQLDKIFESVTRRLSEASKYAGVMLTPRPDFAVVKRIELIPVDNGELLMILIARTGAIVTKKITVSDNITQDALREFSSYLTAELCGYSIHEIKVNVFKQLRASGRREAASGVAVDIAELGLGGEEESSLRIDGIENLLRIPEMSEQDTLVSFLNIIEEKNILREIFEDTMKNETLRTLIGEEIEDPRVTGCSVVATPYKIGNANVGVVGVLGPTRMDYEKVVPMVDYTGRIMSDLLTKMSR